jgi:farnesyl-diphosphate farnesyltransferase
MRLACTWPLLIGSRTLALIARADNLLDPHLTVKIARRVVYRSIVSSSLLAFSNSGLKCYASHLERRFIF